MISSVAPVIKHKQSPIIIALDGPAGAGKSTVAKTLAQTLGYRLLDTGAIYRTVALLAQRQGIAWDDDAGLARLIEGLDITFRYEHGVNHVFASGTDVSQAIRTETISAGAAQVSARPVVRQGLLALQRRLAAAGNAVLEGRDIGTVVCPDAPVKFFLDASIKERARRRYQELKDRDEQVSYDDILAQVTQRDTQDRTRSVSPLRPADDAIVLDSTALSVQEVVERIMQRVKQVKQVKQVEQQ